MTQNEYAATATAEKRLREVLTERLGESDLSDRLAAILLQHAEIEYLPRKKSVSIRLKVPEFAETNPKPATKTEGGTADLPHDTGVVTADFPPEGVHSSTAGLVAGDLQPDDVAPKPATVGAFLPYQVNPEEYEDDFFTE